MTFDSGSPILFFVSLWCECVCEIHFIREKNTSVSCCSRIWCTLFSQTFDMLVNAHYFMWWGLIADTCRQTSTCFDIFFCFVACLCHCCLLSAVWCFSIIHHAVNHHCATIKPLAFSLIHIFLPTNMNKSNDHSKHNQTKSTAIYQFHVSEQILLTLNFHLCCNAFVREFTLA